MRRTHDYLWSYRVAGGAGRCRICIYEAPDRPPAVVVTAVAADADASISSAAPYLAAEVIARHFPDRFEADTPILWFEHYERSEWELKRRLPEYAQVEFSSYRPRSVDEPGGAQRRIGQPRWTRVPREAIEQIIDQPLD